MEDDLIGTAEAAALLGVTPHAVTNWANAGRLPSTRAGGGRTSALRFRRADVLAYRDRRGAAGTRPRLAASAKVIGATDAAAILGVDRQTVINWAKRGAFPAIRYHRPDGRTGLWPFHRDDIAAYVERSRIRPPGNAHGAVPKPDAG